MWQWMTWQRSLGPVGSSGPAGPSSELEGRQPAEPIRDFNSNSWLPET